MTLTVKHLLPASERTQGSWRTLSVPLLVGTYLYAAREGFGNPDDTRVYQSNERHALCGTRVVADAVIRLLCVQSISHR